MADDSKARTTGRREFLSQLSAAAVAGLAMSGESRAEEGQQPAAMPTMELGKYRVSRLVAGWNPIGGYSYLGSHTDRHMKDYFTTDRTVEFLQACAAAGITLHQFSPADNTAEILRKVRERGAKMEFICLDSKREAVAGMIEKTSPIAMVHHGGATDSLFAQGKSGEVRDYVKEAHDRGVLAGVSAHNPECIRRIADEGWKVDFFMTCFYFLTRKHAPGQDDAPPTLQVDYPFYRADPLAMTQVVRQVRQPCLGFKILAAGRLAHDQNSVREAFRFAFQNIKAIDGVIVGMYPRFFDEIGANAQLAREFGKAS